MDTIPSPSRGRPVRCLALSVDIGAGHRRAAEAIGGALETLRPGSTFEIVEALDYLGAGAGKTARELYFGLLESAPELWGKLYEGRELHELLRPVSAFVDSVRAQDLLPRVRAFQPDVLLAMHPIPCGLAGALARSGEIAFPTVAVLTDFDAHPAWIAEGIDLYLVPTRGVAGAMTRKPLPSGRVEVTGLPIRPAFAARIDRAGVRKTLGLATDRFTVLLLGGGMGLGPILEVARTLDGLEPDLQVVLIAGGNEELRTSAQELAVGSRIPIRVTGLVENMWDYMAAADVAVGKPGGSTCAELLAMGVPLVALAPIPGQEQANARALVRDGAAVEADTAQAAAEHVVKLLGAPETLEVRRAAALALGRPHAASDAGKSILKLIDVKEIGSHDATRMTHIPRRSGGSPFDKLFGAFEDVLRGAEASLSRAEAARGKGPASSLHAFAVSGGQNATPARPATPSGRGPASGNGLGANGAGGRPLDSESGQNRDNPDRDDVIEAVIRMEDDEDSDTSSVQMPEPATVQLGAAPEIAPGASQEPSAEPVSIAPAAEPVSTVPGAVPQSVSAEMAAFQLASPGLDTVRRRIEGMAHSAGLSSTQDRGLPGAEQTLEAFKQRQRKKAAEDELAALKKKLGRE